MNQTTKSKSWIKIFLAFFIPIVAFGLCCWWTMINKETITGMMNIIFGPWDENPVEKAEFFEAHEDDFSNAVNYGYSWECSLCTNLAPDEIQRWAGQDSSVAKISEKGELLVFRIDTDVGSFMYIPDSSTMPSEFQPTPGVIISCSREYGNGWYECRWTFD